MPMRQRDGRRLLVGLQREHAVRYVLRLIIVLFAQRVKGN